MRLNRFLALAAKVSRRGADRLVFERRVTINGEVVLSPARFVDIARDAVKVDGKRVSLGAFVYYAFHKPAGVVSTLNDPQGRPSLAPVVEKMKGNPKPVGRLDFHTEGLLLFTNDGALAEKLLRPRSRVARVYEAKVKGILTDRDFDRFSKGLFVSGLGRVRAKVEPLKRFSANSRVRVTLFEARNRQVRRMFAAAGHPVLRLVRVAFGPVFLGALAPGRFRPLTEVEIELLKERAE